MPEPLILLLGLVVWAVVLWDGFATIVMPRPVEPLRRMSGLVYLLSWRLWRAIGSRLPIGSARFRFFSVYGPLSVVMMLVLWGFSIIMAFALMYQGLGVRAINVADDQQVDFLDVLYMSGSTFLTLGLGDVVATTNLGRFFVILEAGSGLTFLTLIVTYMPTLDGSFTHREVGSLRIQSRAGRPPSATGLLRGYAGLGGVTHLTSDLEEFERWMAMVAVSHVAHPVVAYYRAQRWGTSWLVALAVTLDACAILIAEGNTPATDRARSTFRMGLRLLEDLRTTLHIRVEHGGAARLTIEDIPGLEATLATGPIKLPLGTEQSTKLLRLVSLYDPILLALAGWLVVELPPWSHSGGPGASVAGLPVWNLD
jgi:Ion channel